VGGAGTWRRPAAGRAGGGVPAPGVARRQITPAGRHEALRSAARGARTLRHVALGLCAIPTMLVVAVLDAADSSGPPAGLVLRADAVRDTSAVGGIDPGSARRSDLERGCPSWGRRSARTSHATPLGLVARTEPGPSRSACVGVARPILVRGRSVSFRDARRPARAGTGRTDQGIPRRRRGAWSVRPASVAVTRPQAERSRCRRSAYCAARSMVSRSGPLRAKTRMQAGPLRPATHSLCASKSPAWTNWTRTG